MICVVSDIFLDRYDRKRFDSRKRASLPDQHDLLAEEAKSVIEESAPVKTLYGVKRAINNGYELQAVEMEKLGDEFRLERFGPDTQADIKLMIESIMKQPLGRGTKKMVSSNAKVRINGNHVVLRRLSPLDRKIEGRNSKESIRIRISYAITSGGVAIVDILGHDEFDKKYS